MKITKETLLQESSMSRLYRHNIEHDCSSISAFLIDISNEENRARHKSLKAKLLALGYDITEIRGKYTYKTVDPKDKEKEISQQANELSFYIVDSNDSGQLEKHVIDLSVQFEQDSVLFMPKGSTNDTTLAYLIGTDKENEDNWLPFGQKKHFNKGAFFGEEGEDYTSYVNNRPYTFKEEVKKPRSGSGWWALKLAAKKDWREFLK